MSRAFTPGLQVVEKKSLRKCRELPVPGNLLVKVGDQIASSDLVARADLPGDLVILRIAEKMGLQAFEVLDGLQCQEGQSLNKGDLMCEYTGLFGLVKTRYFAPIAGTIEFINKKNAHIGFRKPSMPVELKAYISGKVVEVEEQRAVTVETEAAFMQGIFGVGGEQVGTLTVLNVENNRLLEVDDIPDDCTGMVLVGGTCPSIDVLSCARDRGAVGFVTGAVDDIALRQYLGYDLGIALTGDEDLTMTLIATEGFGKIALSERIRNLCKKFEGRPCSINGATQVRAGALRPEIIVTHENVEASDTQDNSHIGLTEGVGVRIIRVPYFGEQGIVSSLPVQPQQIESGARTRVVEVKLQDGQRVVVPRANVELM